MNFEISEIGARFLANTEKKKKKRKSSSWIVALFRDEEGNLNWGAIALVIVIVLAIILLIYLYRRYCRSTAPEPALQPNKVT